MELFNNTFTILEENNAIDEQEVIQSLENLLYRYAALSWFNEQVETPELLNQRGLNSVIALPEELDLFDSQGLPKIKQKKSNWIKLEHWLANDQAILDFVFPKGKNLSTEDKTLLLNDLKTLRTQIWSPQTAVKAILEDWPEDEKDYNISLEASKKTLFKECKKIIALAKQQ